MTVKEKYPRSHGVVVSTLGSGAYTVTRTETGFTKLFDDRQGTKCATPVSHNLAIGAYETASLEGIARSAVDIDWFFNSGLA